MDPRTLIMHQVMLGDRARLAAYDVALAAAVAPGDVVVDVGAGTLALSLLALRHGARHVYALEADPQTAALARIVAERNGLTGRLTLIQGDARRARLPRQADVIVSEMMGNLGPEEEMAEILAAVARRNLKPTGRVVPERLTTEFVPVQLGDEGWGVWSDDFWGFSLSAVQEYAPGGAQLHFFNRPPVTLGTASVAADDRLGKRPGGLRQDLTLRITEPGMLQAVAGYFTATLAPGVSLTNLPGYPGCNWAVWLWPVRHTEVEPGDVVEVKVHPPTAVRDAAGWRLDCAVARSRGGES